MPLSTAVERADDVQLPSADADIDVPSADVDMKGPSADIHVAIPELGVSLEGLEADAKVKVKKDFGFKMPDFHLLKFGRKGKG